MSCKVNVKVGDVVTVHKKRERTDGLLDHQIFKAKVTYVDTYRADYEVTEHLLAKNVLMICTHGGFSLSFTKAELGKFSGIYFQEEVCCARFD